MSNPKATVTKEDEKALLKSADVVNSQLQTLETFIARRFDEISMEINASAQQADMAENTMGEKFSDILEALGAINYSGDGETAANTGVELDTVVKQTEQAVNSIMDETDGIMEAASDSVDWSDPKQVEKARATINEKANNIIMACSFQDLSLIHI